MAFAANCSGASSEATSTVSPRSRERALSAKLASSELALFDGWAALARGEQPSAGLALASVPLLATILEALLRVQEFDSFERLLACWAAATSSCASSASCSRRST